MSELDQLWAVWRDRNQPTLTPSLVLEREMELDRVLSLFGAGESREDCILYMHGRDMVRR